jgi:hypothetical protein
MNRRACFVTFAQPVPAVCMFTSHSAAQDKDTLLDNTKKMLVRVSWAAVSKQ